MEGGGIGPTGWLTIMLVGGRTPGGTVKCIVVENPVGKPLTYTPLPLTGSKDWAPICPGVPWGPDDGALVSGRTEFAGRGVWGDGRWKPRPDAGGVAGQPPPDGVVGGGGGGLVLGCTQLGNVLCTNLPANERDQTGRWTKPTSHISLQATIASSHVL